MRNRVPRVFEDFLKHYPHAFVIEPQERFGHAVVLVTEKAPPYATIAVTSRADGRWSVTYPAHVSGISEMNRIRGILPWLNRDDASIWYRLISEHLRYAAVSMTGAQPDRPAEAAADDNPRTAVRSLAERQKLRKIAAAILAALSALPTVPENDTARRLMVDALLTAENGTT